jgi:chromosome segregation ATPase
METTEFAKQTLKFQKTVFENSFNAMVMVQEQTEKMYNSYLEKLPWVTEDAKKTLESSADMAKKARDDFKKAVEDGFTKFEELMEEKK